MSNTTTSVALLSEEDAAFLDQIQPFLHRFAELDTGQQVPVRFVDTNRLEAGHMAVELAGPNETLRVAIGWDNDYGRDYLSLWFTSPCHGGGSADPDILYGRLVD
jgi:hypothetical protein